MVKYYGKPSLLDRILTLLRGLVWLGVIIAVSIVIISFFA